MLRNKYSIHLDRLEKRQQHIFPPWWIPPVIHIAESREAALEEHDKMVVGTLRVYADGSKVKDHVAAAAVMQITGEWIVRTAYMGRSTTSNVYAAELRGIGLALELVLDQSAATGDLRKCTIYSDNQAAVRALADPKCSSGQYILADTVKALDELRGHGWEVRLCWIPAHSDVLGNEKADQAAKEEAARHMFAAQTTTEPLLEPDSLQILTATTKPTNREKMKNEWRQAWEMAKHGRGLCRLGVKPGKGTLKTHIGLNRALSSVITQMRNGKIGLRAYLHSINKADSDQCLCRLGRQTVKHILLECKDWAQEREQMWAGKPPCADIRQVLCSPSLAVQAATMMIRTSLLEQFRAVPSTVLNYSM